MLETIVEEWPRFATYYNAVFLLQAMFATFALSMTGCVIGLLLGLAIAVMRRTSGIALLPFRTVAILFVEMFRRIPFLVTLMIVFFSFQQVLQIETSVFTVAVVSVCLIATAFLSEIIRAGFDSVHANQWDAAVAMNFSLLQTLRWVVVPQAWKVVLPPAFSFFILFIKDTALASQIGVVELTYAGKVLNNKGFSAALVFGTILLLYFALSYPLSRLGVWMEAKLATPGSR